MILTRMNYSLRPLILPLLVSTLLYLIPPSMCAQDKSVQARKIENARWNVAGNIVKIHYDLIAPADSTYETKVLLKREGFPSLQINPETVSGSVGIGSFAGRNQEIQWNYIKDIPEGIYGDGYYFEITSRVVLVSGGSTWYYYALGAIAVLGGGGAYLLGKRSGPGSTVINPTPLLPEAPKIRPNQ